MSDGCANCAARAYTDQLLVARELPMISHRARMRARCAGLTKPWPRYEFCKCRSNLFPRRGRGPRRLSAVFAL